MNSVIPGTIEEPSLDTDKLSALEASYGGAVNMHTIKGQVGAFLGLSESHIDWPAIAPCWEDLRLVTVW